MALYKAVGYIATKHSDTQGQTFRTHSRSPRSYVTLKIRRRHSCRCPRLAISSSAIALPYVVLVLRSQSSRQQCSTLCISSRANKISRTKPVLDEGTLNQPLHFSNRREESYRPLFHFERRSTSQRRRNFAKIGRYRPNENIERNTAGSRVKYQSEDFADPVQFVNEENIRLEAYSMMSVVKSAGEATVDDIPRMREEEKRWNHGSVIPSWRGWKDMPRKHRRFMASFHDANIATS